MPPQAVCVSCVSSTTECCSPRRWDTCTTPCQQSRLSPQIEKNKIESSRRRTPSPGLDERRYSFASSMIVVCVLGRCLFKFDPRQQASMPVSLAPSPASEHLVKSRSDRPPALRAPRSTSEEQSSLPTLHVVVLLHRRLHIPSGCAPPTANGLAMQPVARPRKTLSSLASIRSPQGFRPQEHHQPPCIVVYARHRRPAARISASTSLYSDG